MRKVEPARKSVHTGWQPTAGGTQDGRRSRSSINDRDVGVPALEVTVSGLAYTQQTATLRGSYSVTKHGTAHEPWKRR